MQGIEPGFILGWPHVKLMPCCCSPTLVPTIHILNSIPESSPHTGMETLTMHDYSKYKKGSLGREGMLGVEHIQLCSGTLSLPGSLLRSDPWWCLGTISSFW